MCNRKAMTRTDGKTEGNHLYASPSVNENATDFDRADDVRAVYMSSAIGAGAALFPED